MLHVSEQPETSAGRAVATVAVAVAEPYRVTVQDEPQTWRHIEIVETGNGGRVVTAIEFLSPANKVGSQAQLNYIRKQREFLNARVNLVEVDLIRAGNYVLALPEERLPAACRSAYMACVRRATKRNVAEIYAMPLRQPLPNIRVPLRPTDEDAVLRLQELIDDCYRDGRYAPGLPPRSRAATARVGRPLDRRDPARKGIALTYSSRSVAMNCRVGQASLPAPAHIAGMIRAIGGPASQTRLSHPTLAAACSAAFLPFLTLPELA